MYESGLAPGLLYIFCPITDHKLCQKPFYVDNCGTNLLFYALLMQLFAIN